MGAGSDIAQQLKDLAPTISVGVVAADLLSLGSELAILEDAGVSLLHVDVMDGCFTPVMTVGLPMVKALRMGMIKDVHLMIEDPIDKIDAYVAAGADIITVHVESTPHIHRALQAMGGMTNANDPARGLVRGAALNPGTPACALEPLLDELEMVLLLAVNPGWGGQKFIESTRRKLDRVMDMIRRSGREILTCIDGGVKRENIEDVARMGADIVVTGSAVFDGKAPAENARFMLEALKKCRKT
jgi:ribulose-phosphate 3-epimerase